jgi:hypothetical protein
VEDYIWGDKVEEEVEKKRLETAEMDAVQVEV